MTNSFWFSTDTSDETPPAVEPAYIVGESAKTDNKTTRTFKEGDGKKIGETGTITNVVYNIDNTQTLTVSEGFDPNQELISGYLQVGDVVTQDALGSSNTSPITSVDFYDVSDSILFDSGDLTRTVSTANASTYTVSCWIKRGGIGSTNRYLFGVNNNEGFGFNSNNKFFTYVSGSTNTLNDYTFSDTSKWHHVVLSVNAGTVTVYIDARTVGTLTAPNYQNGCVIGSNHGSSPFSGYIADFQLIDNQALTPPSFGEFTTAGFWQPKDYAGTYGSKGFHLDFSDPNLGNDVSGQNNDWTSRGVEASTAGISTSLISNVVDTQIRGGWLESNMNSGAGAGTWVILSANNGLTVFGGAKQVNGSQNWMFSYDGGVTVTGGGFLLGGSANVLDGTIGRDSNGAEVFALSTNGNDSVWFAPTANNGVNAPVFTKKHDWGGGIGWGETIAYSPTLNRWLALKNGSIQNNNNITISDDGGNTWSQSAGLGGNLSISEWNYLEWNSVFNRFVALSYNGKVAYSSNGLQWTESQPFSEAQHGLVLIPDTGTMLVTNLNGYGDASYARSTNGGVSWSTLSSSVTGMLIRGGAYSSELGRLVLSGVSAGTPQSIIYSDDDGQTFQFSGQPGGSGGEWSLGGPGYDPVTKNFIVSLESGPQAGTQSFYSGSGSEEDGPSTGELTFASPNPNLTLFNPGDIVSSGGSSLLTPAFSTTSYSGNVNGGKNVTTGIDNTVKSMIWIKNRNGSSNNYLVDTERGKSYASAPDIASLSSNLSRVETSAGSGVNDLSAGANVINTNGFRLTGGNNDNNAQNNSYVAWNFRAAPRFFDVVTYDGKYSSNSAVQQIPHNLGVAPGMIIIKSRTLDDSWWVYHKDLGEGFAINLNLTSAKRNENAMWDLTKPTSTTFTVGDDNDVNALNQKFVAYLFADDPSNVVSGSYSGTGGPQTIETGFEPGFVITKAHDQSSDWYVMDNTRPGKALYANGTINQQSVDIGYTSNGFTINGAFSALNASGYNYIYIAIRANLTAVGYPLISEVIEVDTTNNQMTVDKIGYSAGDRISKGAVIGQDYKDTPVTAGTDTGLGGELTGNYATLDPTDGSPTLSNGNLTASSSNAYPTIIPERGSWYYEVDGTGYVWDGTRANWTPRTGVHNFGQKPFVTQAPSGSKTLCSTNL